MKAIAAMSRNRVIGRDGEIPWHLPEDFKWFKRVTMGQVVVLGRKTFESLGKPLPGRRNYVLTREPRKIVKDPRFSHLLQEGKSGRFADPDAGRYEFILPGPLGAEVWIARDLELLDLHGVRDTTWLCGGAQIYEQYLDQCLDLFLSVVFIDVPGDAYFPPFEDRFTLVDVPLRTSEFEVRHYRHV